MPRPTWRARARDLRPAYAGALAIASGIAGLGTRNDEQFRQKDGVHAIFLAE
ncbi:MAG: hypothetical protein QME59_03620 [Candidatus Hydrothermarchaeota archaeon]|nr:hypothetical protein [Candidatus Hydrothermarchaeota archaeon]